MEVKNNGNNGYKRWRKEWWSQKEMEIKNGERIKEDKNEEKDLAKRLNNKNT